MAVEDKYVNALIAAGKKAPPYFAAGAQLLCIPFNFEVAAADSNESVYRIGRLPANAIPVKGEVFADSSIDGTDFDFGLYKPGVGGAIVDIDILADGLDLASGEAITAPLNILTNLGGSDPIASVGKTLWELLALTKPNRGEYDLVITARVAGGAAGTISGFFWYTHG